MVRTTSTRTDSFAVLAAFVAVALAFFGAAPARADADDDQAPEQAPRQGDDVEESAAGVTLDTLWQEVLDQLDEASDELEPKLEKPRPHPVNWQARRISSMDLGAPLLALSSGDLDGDGRAEILALTTDEVIIVERRGRRRLEARARAGLNAPYAAVRPRDPVGTLLVRDVDGDGRAEVLARSSTRARATVFRFTDGALVDIAPVQGFPFCASFHGMLEPGRNYFTQVEVEVEVEVAPLAPRADAEPRDDDGAAPTAPTGPVAPTTAARVGTRAFVDARPERFFSARCSADGLVDTAGRKLALVGIVENDATLHLWSEKRCPRRDTACQATRSSERDLADSGTTFEIADMDRDGHPEIIVTAAVPPGQGDRVSVLSWRDERLQSLYQRSFSGGVVGLTAGDIDGDDQLELLAAVRLWGSHRIDLWIFNR